ncbi:hypothetical protein T265_03250 [Opisthorchis viverrini]|uniref:Uncharacterized protein n=1 Tax=Opisthorchis viverrini TaxID=6198 RepID=A0A074ZWM5_OPIVI|nr:hypothetical protein T265_03250 [Opisthorchis viverrini]KER30302.1 hypothetical protein T265_03250 [Opisthorchis viverrini]
MPRLEVLLFVLFVIFIPCVILSDSENAPQLIDSLYLPSDLENAETKGQSINTFPDSDIPPYSNRYIQPQPVHSTKDVGGEPRNRFYLDEGLCPSVHCFTFRNSTTRKVVLDCQDEITSTTNTIKILERINCSFWKNPTTTHSFRTAVITGPAVAEGRGYDLKIILSPAQVDEGRGDAVRRLHIDHLVPGVLGWIVQTLRHHLQLELSPVHLTISYIYIATLRRIDLGDLSTRSRVTRLSIWNPFNWEDDSLIPNTVVGTKGNFAYAQDSILPPYFRLTVFCDVANRISSFRRLWLPWKSWQVRFYHCHDNYECRSWISRYPICDVFSSQTFMPVYFLLPQPSVGTYSSPKHYLRLSGVNSRNKAGNQLLFETTCQREAGLWDPVDDLKLDHVRKCWQPNVYSMDTNQRVESLDSVVIVPESESNRDESEAMTTSTATPKATKAVTLSSTPSTQAPGTAFENQTSTKEPVLLNTSDTSTTKVDHVSSPPTLLQMANAPAYSFDDKPTMGKSSPSESYLIYIIISLVLLVLFLLFALIFAILCIRRRVSREKQQDKFTNGYLCRLDGNTLYGSCPHPLSSSVIFLGRGSNNAYSPRSVRNLPRTCSEYFTSTVVDASLGDYKAPGTKCSKLQSNNYRGLSNPNLNASLKAVDRGKVRTKSPHDSQISMNSVSKQLNSAPSGLRTNGLGELPSTHPPQPWHSPKLTRRKQPGERFRKSRMFAFWRRSKRPHTMVFEDGDFSKENWPEGLKSSLAKIL